MLVRTSCTEATWRCTRLRPTLEDVLDGRADLIIVDQNHLVDDARLEETPAFFADDPDGRPVTEEADLVEHDALALRKALGERVGVDRLYANDLDVRRRDGFDVARNAGEEPPAADANKDGVERVHAVDLAEDLDGDRRLPRNDEGVVKGRDLRPPFLGRQARALAFRHVKVVSVQEDRRAQPLHILVLDGRRVERHDDGRLDP